MISYSFENEKNGWQAKRTLYSTNNSQKLYREQYVDGEIRNHGTISFKYNGSESFKSLVKGLINERDDIIISYMNEDWLEMNYYRPSPLNLKEKNAIKEILESNKDSFERAVQKTLKILDNELD